MERDAKIYVAGHKGLVGSAICRKLRSEGYNNLITRTHKELDLTRQAQVEEFFRSERPEYVFLAAAKVGGILANNTFPGEFIYENLTIQCNVIHEAYKTEVKKLLFLGSSCIYPRDCPQPMKEEYLLTGKLEPTNEPYAIAKIAGIKMCQSYNRQYGTRFISVMPTNLYGPGDNFDLETSHVLPALIRKFHEAKIREANLGEVGARRLEGKEGREHSRSRLERSAPQTPGHGSVIIWGTGRPRREFLYVDDAADACVFLMNTYEENDIVNIGVGKDISIGELAELIKDVVGFEGEIQFDTTKPDGMPRKLLDVSRLESLGWKSKISLREGIERTYEWYKENRLEDRGWRREDRGKRGEVGGDRS
ncbi:MAG: GDP-L-fucose synthase, partial [Deltaproteobacteria bacterium]|nr:GDP-L-fucose synthase [Deltaproteobacteria bacterium]